MTDFNKQVASDLAKKYTYENFDFKNKSIEDLSIAYNENYEKARKIISSKSN